jgi:hypothetical protein
MNPACKLDFAPRRAVSHLSCGDDDPGVGEVRDQAPVLLQRGEPGCWHGGHADHGYDPLAVPVEGRGGVAGQDPRVQADLIEALADGLGQVGVHVDARDRVGAEQLGQQAAPVPGAGPHIQDPVPRVEMPVAVHVHDQPGVGGGRGGQPAQRHAGLRMVGVDRCPFRRKSACLKPMS